MDYTLFNQHCNVINTIDTIDTIDTKTADHIAQKLQILENLLGPDSSIETKEQKLSAIDILEQYDNMLYSNGNSSNK